LGGDGGVGGPLGGVRGVAVGLTDGRAIFSEAGSSAA
jgi:hypothetical protein